MCTTDVSDATFRAVTSTLLTLDSYRGWAGGKNVSPPMLKLRWVKMAIGLVRFVKNYQGASAN